MRGSLGEKIGEGAYSEVHAWAPGRVVKLFKAGVPPLLSWWEARMTRAVFAAGGPAPEVLDEVTLEGRFGIVLPRFDGPTLLQLTRSGAMSFGQAGAVLASVGLSVHKTPPPPEVDSLRESMQGTLRLAGSAVPKPVATGILALIDRLRPGDGLCHGDLHPDNVIMTAQGPRLIDWIGAVRAPAAFDLAISHILLTELAPQFADDPKRPRAVNAALQSEYARLTGLSDAALTAAIEPFLPIVDLRVLLGPTVGAALRERLMQRVEAALRAQDSMRSSAITITAFECSPDGGRGLARDTRVRWALEEVGQPYAVRPVSFQAMKQPAHLALHPFGQIPTYEEGNLALFETGAIVLHIAERHAGLLPDDADARARAIAWMFAAVNTVEPPILDLGTARLLERDKPWHDERIPLVEDRVRIRLRQLSARLGDADWLDGAFSAGDLMMVSVLLRLKSSGILDEYPNLAAYLSRGEARPAYQRAFAAQLAFNTGKPPTG